MDRNIKIEIKDRIAHLVGNPKIICGNNDYSVTFTFDDEWTGVDVKTLRVSYNNKYSDHVFTGNTVELPPIIKAVEVYLGVFAGDITSTKVAVRAEPSILCAGGSVADPEPDVYAQIINLVNTGKLKGDPGEKGEKGDQGDKGDPGEPGKDADPYILPTASETVKGGVKIGEGLRMDGDVLNAVGGGSEGVYEWIETITLEEDVILERTAEPDGTPYKFDEMWIKINTGETAGITSGIYYYGESGWFFYQYFMTSKSESAALNCKKERGYWVALKCVGGLSQNEYTHTSYAGRTWLLTTKVEGANTYIRKILSISAIPAGTIIEIWGVRA